MAGSAYPLVRRVLGNKLQHLADDEIESIVELHEPETTARELEDVLRTLRRAAADRSLRRSPTPSDGDAAGGESESAAHHRHVTQGLLGDAFAGERHGDAA